MENKLFEFENLNVWSKAVDFTGNILTASPSAPKNEMQQAFLQKAALASTSIATNIAEGKGSYSKKTYLLYLEDARRSVYATVSFLEFIARKNWITSDQHEVLKEEGFVLVKMLSAFMKAIKTGNSSKTEAEEAPVPN